MRSRISRISPSAILLTLVLVVALAAIWVYAPKPVTALPEPGYELVKASKGLDHYAFDLVLDTNRHSLSGTLTLSLVNRDKMPLTDLVFRCYPNTAAASDDEPHLDGGFETTSIQMQGQALPYRYIDEAKTALAVDIPPLEPGERMSLMMVFSVSVPERAHRFGHTGGVYMLGNALPLLSVLDAGRWRTDAMLDTGDPFVSDAANIDVRLRLPAGYSCHGSAAFAKSADDPLLFEAKALAMRDFGLVAASSLKVATQLEGDTMLTAVAPDAKLAGVALKHLAQSVRALNGLYGVYPYPALTVALVPLGHAGMEYPGLMMIDEDLKDPALLEVIAHETAHQWFYGLVGSDQLRDPWQDEALTEWAAARVLGKAPPVQTAQRSDPHALPVGSPLSAFGAAGGDYHDSVYVRGYQLMARLDEALNGKLDHFLKTYVARFRFLRASRSDFATLLTTFAGRDMAPWLNEALDAPGH